MRLPRLLPTAINRFVQFLLNLVAFNDLQAKHFIELDLVTGKTIFEESGRIFYEAIDAYGAIIMIKTAMLVREGKQNERKLLYIEQWREAVL